MLRAREKTEGQKKKKKKKKKRREKGRKDRATHATKMKPGQLPPKKQTNTDYEHLDLRFVWTFQDFF
jgi:hypothetical protein